MKEVDNKIFTLMILVFYVNDIFFLAKNQFNVDKYKNQLKFEFKMNLE